MAKRTNRREENSHNTPREGDRRQEPVWRNTRPRGNPETHEQDLHRSRERFEALLGR